MASQQQLQAPDEKAPESSHKPSCSSADTTAKRHAPLSWLQACPRLIWDSGMTCSLLASLIFAFSALFVKLTAGRVPVLEVCFIRSSISLGLSFILMHISGMNCQQFFGQRKNLRLLFLRGCCGAFSMTTYYVALFMLPLGDAVTINLIGPPVTAIFARLLLKEPLGYRGMLGCCISLAGVVLVARPPFLFGGHEEWAGTRSIGSAAGVVSAVLGGGSSMTIRLIGGSEPAAVIAVWFHTATMSLSLFPLLAGVPNKPALLSRADGGYMMGVAGTSFVAQLLSTRGLQRCQAAKAAAMGFTQVVYSNIMGFAFCNDKPTLGSFFGTMLILVGVLLVTLRSSSTKPAAAQAACLSTAASAVPAAGFVKAGDSEAEALLPSAHVHSHLAAATGEDDESSAVAVVKLRITSGPAKGSTAVPRAEDEQPDVPRLVDASAVGEGGTAEIQETEQHCLLLQIAASAAALGGELCPAGSTAVALDLSRQVSRQLGTSFGLGQAVSQMSRQPSQWLAGTTSAFLTGPGLVWQQQQQPAATGPEVHPVQQSQQQQEASHEERQLPAETQAQGEGSGLKQALLPGSLTSTALCQR